MSTRIGEFLVRYQAKGLVVDADLKDSHFAPSGLTDLGIARLAEGSLLVLSADSRLAAYLNQLGVEAVDFQALRHLSRP